MSMAWERIWQNGQERKGEKVKPMARSHSLVESKIISTSLTIFLTALGGPVVECSPAMQEPEVMGSIPDWVITKK